MKQDSTLHKTMLDRVQEFPLIPQDAFLYVPQKLDYKIKQRQATRRFIFRGGAEFDQFEKGKLRQFDEYLKQNNLTLGEYWVTPQRLRFIISAFYNLKNTYKDMLQYDEYRVKVDLTKESQLVRKYVHQGFIYISGRDSKYRPIIITDIKKIVDSNIESPEMIQLLTYMFEKIIKQCLLDGHVENWVVIVDMGKVGLLSLVQPIKNIVGFLSKTFKCRMFATYLINCPFSINMLWKIGKGFLQADTVDKINILDDKPDPLFAYADKSQIQVKYGGIKPNMTKFWPVQFTSQHYSNPKCPITLMSPHQYKDLFKQNKLVDQGIKLSLVKEIMYAPKSKPIVKMPSLNLNDSPKKKAGEVEDPKQILKWINGQLQNFTLHERQPKRLQIAIPRPLSFDF